MEKLSVEELEELREKEFDERAERDERIQNTISLFRKIACVLAVMIAAAFIDRKSTRLNSSHIL